MMESAFSLKGRRVLITGAAGGIGAATAFVCGQLGAAVVVTDIQPVDKVVDRLRSDGVKAEGHLLDMADRVAVERLADAIGDLDGLVAAGAVCPMDDWITSPDWDDNFDLAMSVNVRGPINLARAWMPRMVARGSGSIVVIGSLAGKTGGVAEANQPHYVASKGAVHGVVRWLSRRAIGHGVNVNGIAPGPVKTNMNANLTFDMDALPMKRLGRPEEIAWPIAFLCSSAASYISGTVLDVNGGTFVG
jgi:3-oxoacyl-[acyl-carrier protein] reductase